MNHPPSALVQTGAQALSASGSPFVPGKPLSAHQPLFGRDDELREISNSLRSPHFGSFNLVGERRIGKTSLLNHLAGHVATYLPAASGQPPFVVIRLNLQAGITNEAQFYGALMREVTAQLPAFADVPEPKAGAAACQQLLQRIKSQQAARVVVLVDEFECIFDAPQAYAQPAFCNSLRSLCEDNRLALVVATRKPLLRYFEQQRLTSPLLSYLTPIHLKELSPAAADALLTQPSDRPLDNRQVRLARAWAGTHPCRLQCAADALYWSQVNSETDAWAKAQYEKNVAQLCFVNPAHLSVLSRTSLRHWSRQRRIQLAGVSLVGLAGLWWWQKLSWLTAALTWGKANIWPLAILAVVFLLLSGKVNTEQLLNALFKKIFDSDKEKDK